MTTLTPHRPRLDGPLSAAGVGAAARRIAGLVRPVLLAPVDPGAVPTAPPDPLDDGPDGDCQVWLALEFMQHTGSFQARGALNFLRAHRECGALPDAGVTASGGSAAALVWAARRLGVPVTVFPADSDCAGFAATTGALAFRADHPLAAAGAGTLVQELRRQVPGLDTIVLADGVDGADGLFAGVAAAAGPHGIRTVAVAPACADRPAPAPASDAASGPVSRVQVTGDRAASARQALWDDRRIAVDPGTAAALAALLDTEPPTRPEHRKPGDRPRAARSYRPAAGEKVVVLLGSAASAIGAN